MWTKWIIGALALGLVGVVYPTLEQKIVQPGDDAPQFSLVTDKGQKITATDFGGKVLVLNFWATWCQPCLEEFPLLNRFSSRLKQDGVVVVGVSVDKNDQQYQRFLRSTQPAFHTMRDPQADISASYGTFQFPETYVIDRRGKIVKKYVGIIDNFPELERFVKTL
jgi:cytochrome c biogenesis protein CcmG, thiol:disulfide interchange protein DsbE